MNKGVSSGYLLLLLKPQKIHAYVHFTFNCHLVNDFRTYTCINILTLVVSTLMLSRYLSIIMSQSKFLSPFLTLSMQQTKMTVVPFGILILIMMLHIQTKISLLPQDKHGNIMSVLHFLHSCFTLPADYPHISASVLCLTC